MPIPLGELVSYLDRYLRIHEVEDEPQALNGLQVESQRSVARIAAAVDACQATIDAAARGGFHLLLVHHGLFWAGLQPLTGRHWRRVRRLVESGLALYAAHIPLDLHPEVGNNAVLARMLGLTDTAGFGNYRGQTLGVLGRLDTTRDALAARLGELLDTTPRVMSCGSSEVRRVGVITGGGGSMIAQARAAGLDTYITGEGAHYTYFDAEEWGLNVIYAGHYATETVGVKALAQHVAERFGLEWEFLDHPTGL